MAQLPTKWCSIVR